MNKRAGQCGDGLSLAGDAGIEKLCLRHIDSDGEIDLVARSNAVQPSRSVPADGPEIGETEPAVPRRLPATGQAELAAGNPVEHGETGFEAPRMRLEVHGQRARARRAVEIGDDLRLALEGPAGDQRESAQIPRRNLQPAVNSRRAEKTRKIGAQGRSGEVEGVESRCAVRRSRAPHRQRKFGADGLSDRRISESDTARLRLAGKGDPRRRLRQRSIRSGAERRGDMVDRSLGEANLACFEGGFERRGGKGAVDRRVEIELSDRVGAGNRACVDLEIELIVGGLAALEVEPGAGRNDMQASGEGNARIVVEKKVSLERRLSGEDWADDAGARPSSREVRSSVSRRATPCRATTTCPLAHMSAPAVKSSFAAKLSSGPAPLNASFAGGKPGRRAKWAKRPPAGSVEFTLSVSLSLAGT